MDYEDGKPLPEGFVYTSDNNEEWLSVEDLKGILSDASFGKEESAAFVLSTIHRLNEKVLLQMINSEEVLGHCGPHRS